MKKKTIALLMAAVMLMGVAIGGTIAWLKANTDPVVNTFTVGDINITLNEKDTDEDTNKADNVEVNGVIRDKANGYKLIPGVTYTKDPVVTVEPGSEASWLFVQVIETNNTLPGSSPEQQIIEWTFNAAGWTPVEAGLYKRRIPAVPADNTGENRVENTFNLITGDQIKINSNLTKDMMQATNPAFTAPNLTFKACAIQSRAIGDDEAVNQAKALLGITTP